MRADPDDAMDRLFDLAVVLGNLMTDRLAQHGLTPARAEVIWLLHRTGPQTQRQLSQALKCSPRNVTGLVDALQTAGFITRDPHPTDRRATLVTLTSQGQALAAPWHTDRNHTADTLFGDATPAELTTFVTILDRVLHRLRQHTPTGINLQLSRE
jgi:DNA-binding MarR family transcriptional regulator